MKETEKKVIQTLMWFTSMGVGFKVAEKVYDVGMLSYMKTFHNDKFNKAINDILKKRA